MLNKCDIIIYNRYYCEIKNIINNKIELINYTTKKENIINFNDTNIIRIPKEKQSFVKKYYKFVENYNDTIDYLKKRFKNNIYNYLDLYNIVNIEYDMSIIKRCHLTFNQLNKLNTVLKQTGLNNIELHKLIINPYNFIKNEFQLITFDKAEKIENEYKLNIGFKDKINSWFIDFTRIKNSFYIEKKQFEINFMKFCAKNNKDFNTYIILINKFVVDKLINGKIYKTTNYFIDYEKKITDMILDLYYEENYDINIEDIKKEIYIFENIQRESKENKKYKLEEAQVNAVINSIINKINIITGFPGTGKSEIVKCILHVNNSLFKKNNSKLYLDDNISDDNSSEDNSFDDWLNSSDYEDVEEENEPVECFIDPKEICIMAPTGLAFLNISKNIPKNVYSSKISGTCHRVVYNVFENIKKELFKKDKNKNKGKSTNDDKMIHKIKYIIIDESSMVDIHLFYDILKVCKYFNSKLLIIGDNNQLQSIGPGVVLNSIINSKIFNVTELTEIKRQNIGALVTNIKQMNYDIITNDDFYDDTIKLINIEDFTIDNKIINKDAILNIINENNLNKENSIFISYFNSDKFVFNTGDLNNIIQNLYNKNDDNLYIKSNNKYNNKFVFKVGDIILRTENDYSSEIMRANGDQAVICDFNKDEVIIKYKGINDKSEKITVDDLYDSFTLAYCITVHKSQGSQYNNVVIFIDKNQTIWDKTALYTAISRSQDRCFIITTPKDFIKIQMNNNKINDKISLLLKESDNYDL
jgi:hypothetical protein